MSTPLDPYHRWLGIPPKHQPPDHYRLLGLERFESDPEVIRDAAALRMAHVRTYQLGAHADLSQKILNELARAKACLLDPQEKAAYDAKLKPVDEAVPRPCPACGQPVPIDRRRESGDVQCPACHIAIVIGPGSSLSTLKVLPLAPAVPGRQPEAAPPPQFQETIRLSPAPSAWITIRTGLLEWSARARAIRRAGGGRAVRSAGGVLAMVRRRASQRRYFRRENIALFARGAAYGLLAALVLGAILLLPKVLGGRPSSEETETAESSPANGAAGPVKSMTNDATLREKRVAIRFNLHGTQHNQYLAETNAARLVTEPQVHYWAPIRDGEEGTVVYRFPFPAPVRRARLTCQVDVFPMFDDRASVAIDVSPDGKQWIEQSELSIAPSAGSEQSSRKKPLDITAVVAGSREVFVRARLRTSRFNIAAQFLRTVPENQGLTLDAYLDLSHAAEVAKVEGEKSKAQASPSAIAQDSTPAKAAERDSSGGKHATTGPPAPESQDPPATRPTSPPKNQPENPPQVASSEPKHSSPTVSRTVKPVITAVSISPDKLADGGTVMLSVTVSSVAPPKFIHYTYNGQIWSSGVQANSIGEGVWCCNLPIKVSKWAAGGHHSVKVQGVVNEANLQSEEWPKELVVQIQSQ